MLLAAASEYLGVSSRQMGRLFARYSAYGLAGLVHGNRLQEPVNKISSAMKEAILRLFREEYLNYNNTHFTEVLNEEKGITIIHEAVRNILRMAFPRSASVKLPNIVVGVSVRVPMVSWFYGMVVGLEEKNLLFV